MSIRTTVTLDDDVLERVKLESRSSGTSFRDTLNGLVRLGLLSSQQAAAEPKLAIQPFHLGYKPGVNYDDIGGLLELAEGEHHR